MILSMTFQCRLFVLAVVLGMTGGFIYTFIPMAAVYLNRAVKNMCDVLFWLLYAIMVFLVMLRVNNGEVRPFSILGIFLGLVIYHTVFEKYACRIIGIVFKTAVRIISTFMEIVLTPIKILLFPVKKLTFCLKKACKNLKSMRK